MAERTKKETEERRLIEQARAEKKRLKQEVPVKQKRKRIERWEQINYKS